MASDELFDGTLDPDLLRTFITELEAIGFSRRNTRDWVGPLHGSLKPFTVADEMVVVIRDGWPYQPPQLKVDGIASWHANQDNLCLWQAGDDTRRWVTVQGILARIDEWAIDASTGFAKHGVGLDPHLYFDTRPAWWALVDVAAHLGKKPKDGQTGRLSWSELEGRVLDLVDGPFKPDTPLPPGVRDQGAVFGLWFFRTHVTSPPQNLDEFQDALTRGQRSQMDEELNRPIRRVLVFALLWQTEYGVAPLIVRVDKDGPGDPVTSVVSPQPKGQQERLLRAGSDARRLRNKRVVVFGSGALGSYVADLLTRSGIGELTLIDGDVLWPVNLIRHAAPANVPPSYAKVDAMAVALSAFEWTTITTVDNVSWHPAELRARAAGADLIVDATGDLAFAELLARIADEVTIPFVTVGLYRGGGLVRVRRQAGDDTAIATRLHHAAYPQIAPGPDEMEYVGVETGCVAPINNASPTAVARGAGLAVDICIDQLAGRRQYADETIEVFRPTDPPFDSIGMLRRGDVLPIVDITESAQMAIRTSAARSHPNETGGVLVGTWIDGRPVIVDAIELPPKRPRPTGYKVGQKVTSTAVENAAKQDPRVGYLGEWHTHPSDHGPSFKDRRTMSRLSKDDDTGEPILIVARPQDDENHKLDAYVTIDGTLYRTELSTSGGLQTLEDV